MMRKLSLLILLLSTIIFQGGVAQPGVSRTIYESIQTRVNSLFGDLYKIRSVTNVDSGLIGSNVQNATVGDPYGTLRGCFVFAAVGMERDAEYAYKGFIGVYKNNQIIWRSDTVINNDIARGATIAAVMDLNKDGTADIVSSWTADSRWGPDYLWIFSWDGTTGRLINAVDDYGQSVIVSVGGGVMEFVDVNGGGVLEIRGFWSDDPNIENLDSPVIYSWNGQLYGKWPDAPQPLPSGYLPRNKLSVAIRSAVTRTQDGLAYQYVVTNDRSSQQEIDEILLFRRTGSLGAGTGRAKWRFAVLKRSLLGWTNLFIEPNPIVRGETESGFQYVSPALPFITTYYVRGHNPTLHTPPFDESASFQDKIENSVKGFTLGPADPPDPFVPAAFLDTLISYKHQAFALGWIKEEGIVTSLDAKLDAARPQIIADRPSAKQILQSFINELDALNTQGNKITSEAYALLKFNAEYLISKL